MCLQTEGKLYCRKHFTPRLVAWYLHVRKITVRARAIYLLVPFYSLFVIFVVFHPWSVLLTSEMYTAHYPLEAQFHSPCLHTD